LKLEAVFLFFEMSSTRRRQAMRLIHSSLLVGAAMLGLGAFALPAAGKDPAIHEMTLRLPDGGIETIRYTGNVAPEVTFVQVPFGITWGVPVKFGFEPSFTAFHQFEADVDRQINAFWRQAQMMARRSSDNGLAEATLPKLTPGGSSYLFVSESFGNNVCSRMTEITSSPDGGKPKVVSRTSGNCNASPSGALAPPSVGTIPVHNTLPGASVPRTAL
jgi:hypothetical protein